MSNHQTGFTLLELMVVIVITAILAVTAYSRISFSDIDLQAAKSDFIGALVLARETAMARTSGSETVTLIATASTVDVRVNDSSISSAYPLSYQDGVTLSSGVGTLTFNPLGETTAQSFTLTKNSSNTTVNVSGVGYAY